MGERDDTAKFASLGSSGELNAREITFSQFTCGTSFQNSFTLDGSTIETVHDLASKLTAKPSLYIHTPAITITLYNKRLMSVDNRRLKAHREANAKIRFIKKQLSELTSTQLSHIDAEAPAENLNVR